MAATIIWRTPVRVRIRKGDARNEHASQRDRPGDAHLLDDGEAEIGVEPHARRQRQRGIGDQPHQDRPEGSGETGRGRHRRDRHSRLAQDRGIDQHDIGHGQEGGEARQYFGLGRCTSFRQAEVSLKCAALQLYRGLRHSVSP
jgi:hypothetical protein